MFYKIENKNCEVYQKLFAMRKQELAWEKENQEAIDKKIWLKYTEFLGRNGQQTFSRTSSYSGFKFENHEKVDLGIWKESPKYPGFYIPNKRTKRGKEMSRFLSTSLKGHRFNIVFEYLNLENLYGSFVLPYVEISNDSIIVIYLDPRQNPKDENVIEITKEEFEAILKK